MNKKLDKLFLHSLKYSINDGSKIVIMSDCHRGAGDSDDNFIKNQNIFKSALLHYYKKGFTYVELGDGDEMWEVKNYQNIINEHIDVFKILQKFHKEDRLIMIYGNHDLCKKSEKIRKKLFYKYYNRETKKEESLLNDLNVYESLVFDYKGHDIFLLHGHQVDLLSGKFWRLSRFLVRYIWRHLERIGINDPTSTAKNYQVSKRVEKKLAKWSLVNDKIIIAGHTHRSIFPKVGQSLYFNDGSCIHPNGITCLEIENGKITLVKWELQLYKNKLISVGRKVIEGEESIINFF